MSRLINVTYHQYINGPAWREKREERLRHDSYRCSRCSSRDLLQVHHITYDRLGSERIEDLETLCESCHKREHGRDPELESAMPDSYYHERWFERERLFMAQREIAEAAGVVIPDDLYDRYCEIHGHR